MTIEIRDFTGGELEGAGLFDELMRTVSSHLKNEYDTGRIAGAEYSTVYLGSMNGAMQTSSQFILSMERTNKEIELMDEQILQAKKQNELLDLQKEQLVIGNATATYNLDFMLPKQYEKLTSEVAMTAQQVLLIQEQVSTQQKQQLQITAQIALTGKQEDLVDEQIIGATFQYTEPTAGLLYAQYTKAMKEVDILAQKKITEDAQTQGTEATVSGLVGKEMTLKQVQGDSFLRDSEQKAAKLYADAFQIMYSVNPDGDLGSTSDPNYWGILGSDSGNVFSKLADAALNPNP
jgi:hypothetical protein